MRIRREAEKDEFEFYHREALDSARQRSMRTELEVLSSRTQVWAVPIETWLDSPYDSVAQRDVYEHVQQNVPGGTVLQLGGTGMQALKALVGGAQRGILVTPVEGEAELARSVAVDIGVGARFEASIGYGENLPIATESIDAIVSAGCLHHTDVPAALREAKRVLRSAGRFGAWDPWHARLYDLGVSIFGKREPGIECRPLNPARMRTLKEVFPESEVRLHGALSRYPLLALGKAKVVPKLTTMHRVTLLDDKLSARVPALRRNGSSVAVLATKA